ncbi:hypothetical protein ACJMK2_038545 [Sinanodonta woodiana]|uniref:Uncharacterized protein n=1 Tax=Sinanodonta woodiana TaxID=1069815 RepID=A0ABD3WD43_SINWO
MLYFRPKDNSEIIPKMWLMKATLLALILLASVAESSAQNPTPPGSSVNPWPCSGNSNNATGCQDPIGTNCTYFAMWKFDPTTNMVWFSMKAKVMDGKFIAVGFSSTPTMLNSDVILGWINSSGKGVVSDRYVENYRALPTEDGTDSNLRDVDVTSVDGLLKVEFKRPRTTLDNAIKDFQFSDTNCAYFLFALNGSVISPVQRHTNRYVTYQKICLTSTCSVEKGGYCPPLQNGMSSTCDERCFDDFSCTGTQKCCSNGCGHSCQDPIDSTCPEGSMMQSSLTGLVMCDRLGDVRCDATSGYKCNLNSKLCCRESKDVNDVCADGPPKKTSSGMPLTCLVDTNCGDQTYWCVPSARDRNTKVCCPKIQKTTLNSTAITCFAREMRCDAAEILKFLYVNIGKIFEAFKALLPVRLQIILRDFNPNDCMSSVGCVLDSMFLEQIGGPCLAQLQTVNQDTSLTEKCRTFSTVVTCINRLCGVSFQKTWNFMLDESVKNKALLPFDVNDVKKCSAPDTAVDPNNPCKEGMPYFQGDTAYICDSMNMCPNEYVCTDAPKLTKSGGVCCGAARQGQCPVINKNILPTCRSKKICSMDANCALGEKCCQEGCRNKTCVKLVNEEESTCLRQYSEAASKLAALNSTCSGRTQIWLPRCNKLGWMPQQVIDNLGISFCVNTTTGLKIPGSEGRGNINCLTIKPGRCPAPTYNGQNCAITQNICMDDSSCSSIQKCCFNGCFKQCSQPDTVYETTDALNIPVCPNGQLPKCCPFDLCTGQTCASSPSAVCRINPCGDICTVEFFNEKNEKIDCSKNVGTCALQRQSVMNMANEYLTMEERRENFLALIRPESDNEISDGNGIGVVPEVDTNMKPDDFKNLNGADICAIFGSYCENGATCSPVPSLLRLCSCPSNFHGFFCQKSVSNLPNPPPNCLLAKSHMDDIYSALTGNLMFGNRLPMELTRVMNTVIQIAKANTVGKFYLPQTSCTFNGLFNQIQCATNVDDRLKVCYCVMNTTTSVEDKTKPYAPEPGLVDCSKPRIYQDIVPRCLYPKDAGTCLDQQKLWFFNTVSGRCEPFYYTGCGGNDNKFSTAFECNIICRSAYNPPKPCENLNCTAFQFCAVSFNGTEQKCEDYPDHCLDDLNSGYGDQEIPSYYFNYLLGMCMKFTYKGVGGNLNRFSSYYQCYQECYRYSFGGVEKEGTCPNRNTDQTADNCGINTCDYDSHCPGDHKCCFTGCSRTCLPPVVTCNGQRCNIGGYCTDSGRCACRELCAAEYDPICGSDGKTYSNLCDLETTACRTNEPIYVATYGNCTIDTTCWTSMTPTSLITAGSKCMEKLAALFSVLQNSTDSFCSVAEKAIKCLADASDYNVNDYLCFLANKEEVEQLLNLLASSLSVSLTPYARGQLLDLKGARTNCLRSVCPISNCSEEYSPLCATDQSNVDITIKNQCELYRKLLCENKTLSVKYNGTCIGSRLCGNRNCGPGQYCVSNQCQCMVSNCVEYSPVCGVKYSDYSRMTYNSICHMVQASCLDSVTRYIVSKSACEEDAMNTTDCPNLMNSMTATGECDTKIPCPTGLKCCQAGPAKLCVKPIRKQVTKTGICPVITYIQMSPDSPACNVMCVQDGDCSGTAKCCQNDACGHPVCTEPIPLGNAEECGNDGIALSWKKGYYLSCRSNDDCPSPASCRKISGGFNSQSASICCRGTTQTINIETIKKKAICNFMPLFGFGCQNGGTCVGDIANGTLCQCKTGTYGVLCDRVGQNSSPASLCQRLHEIGSSIKQKIDSSDSQLEKFRLIQLEPILSSLDVKLLSYIPACSLDGNFAEVQCAMFNDQNICFCADTNTGEMKESSPNTTRKEALDCSILSQGYNLRCLQQRDPGPCNGYFPAYFFNSTSKRCEKFIYGGCQGNKNRFYSLADCVNTCRQRWRACGGITCAQDEVCIMPAGLEKKCTTDGMEMEDVICVKLNAAVVDDNTPLFPECTDSGAYQYKQCKGSFCWCVNDQGTFVPGSLSRDPALSCAVNGPNSSFVRATCPSGSQPVACPGGGDPCNSCKMYDDSKIMMSPQNCQDQCKVCPNGSQPKACKVDKCSSSCKHFPSAVCQINTCTCQEEFVDSERNIIDCNKAQSTCEKYRNEVILNIRQMIADNQQKQQERDRNGSALMCQPSTNQGMQPNAELQTKLDDMWLPQCDLRGQFQPTQCNRAGNRCWCVDPQGQTVSGTERKGIVGGGIPSVSCSQIEVKQALVKWRIDTTFPSTETKKNKIKDGIKAKLQEILGWTKDEVDRRVYVELRAGSIIVEVTIQDEAGKLDAVSAGEIISTAANTGDITVNVDGEVYSPTAGSGALTEVYSNTPKKSDSVDVEERNKIIIIVVVVVGGTLIIAVIIFCVCKIRKKNSTKKINENINLETAAHENVAYQK